MTLFAPAPREDYTRGAHSGTVTRVAGRNAWVKIIGEGGQVWQFGPCRIPDHLTRDQLVVAGDPVAVTTYPLAVNDRVTVLIGVSESFVLARYS